MISEHPPQLSIKISWIQYTGLLYFSNHYQGKDGIGRGKLEKLTILEMFDQLLKSNYINENNLLYLQAALPDRLRSKVTNYAKERGGILYFDSPLETPGETLVVLALLIQSYEVL